VGICTYTVEERILMKVAVFWVVAPCSTVEVYRLFRGANCPHHRATTHRRDDGGSVPVMTHSNDNEGG
jgi:hypothetical protein